MEYLTEEQAIALCIQTNHSDLFEQEDYWWAFPLNGVIPVQVARIMKYQKAHQPCQDGNRLTRGHLNEISERIPNALGIAARSMGIEPRELLSEIERGEVISDHAPPSLSQQPEESRVDFMMRLATEYCTLALLNSTIPLCSIENDRV